jgi:hypothetical protein
VAEPVSASRPFCAEVSRASDEPLGATASRVEHWILVEHAGFWPHEPLDASIFAGALRDHLAAQLARLPNSRLLLVRSPVRARPHRLRLFYGLTPERGRRFWTLRLERPDDLLALELAAALRGEGVHPGEPLEHPLLLVCTHGKRDRCCARYGRALCEAMHRRAPAGWVWQSSHVGGDRFAGNLVCLPEGLYFGRVGRSQVQGLLTAYLEGRIDLDHYRGRSCYPFAVQAAELEVRRRMGLVGFSDLRVGRRKRIGDGRWRVELLAEVDGDRYQVEVAVEEGKPEYLTCHARDPRPPQRFVVRSCRRASEAERA